MVEPTHLKNSQNGNLLQIGMNIKSIWNHHLAFITTMDPKIYIFVSSPNYLSFKKSCITGFTIWMFPKIVGFPPKSSHGLIGFSIVNHPIWGTPIFGNTHFLAIHDSMVLNWKRTWNFMKDLFINNSREAILNSWSAWLTRYTRKDGHPFLT